MVNNPSRLTINDIAARCEKVKWQGHHSFTACCVAHSDQNPSMAVTEAEDGMILAHCFSGCAQGVVIEALGIRGVKRDDYVPALKVVRKKHKQVPSTFSYAKEIWAASSAPDGRSVGTHPYAVKKRITHAFGVCRVAVSGRLLGKDGDCIVVPNRNWDGELVGVECINCDACLRACPPNFGAIFNHGADVVIIPELCSGCDKCLPACPVDCIYPDPDWTSETAPDDWWGLPRTDADPYV